jgi:hypothetical protein
MDVLLTWVPYTINTTEVLNIVLIFYLLLPWLYGYVDFFRLLCSSNYSDHSCLLISVPHITYDFFNQSLFFKTWSQSSTKLKLVDKHQSYIVYPIFFPTATTILQSMCHLVATYETIVSCTMNPICLRWKQQATVDAGKTHHVEIILVLWIQSVPQREYHTSPLQMSAG